MSDKNGLEPARGLDPWRWPNGSQPLGTRRYRYRQDKATKNLYFYSFFPRTLRQWNNVNLPADIVESNSLSQFQSKLSDHVSHV